MKPPTVNFFRKTIKDAYNLALSSPSPEGFVVTYSPEAGDGMISPQYVLIKNSLRFSMNVEPSSSDCSVCVLVENDALLVYSCGNWTDEDGPWRAVIIDTLKELAEKTEILGRVLSLRKLEAEKEREKQHERLVENARKLFK